MVLLVARPHVIFQVFFPWTCHFFTLIAIFLVWIVKSKDIYDFYFHFFNINFEVYKNKMTLINICRSLYVFEYAAMAANYFVKRWILELSFVLLSLANFYRTKKEEKLLSNWGYAPT